MSRKLSVGIVTASLALLLSSCLPRKRPQALTSSSSTSTSTITGDLDHFTDRTQWIDRFGAEPAKCIDHVDKLHPDAPIFHGCYDWHSAVLAYWALFRMDLAGSGQQKAAAEHADANLTPEKLAVIEEAQRRGTGPDESFFWARVPMLATEHQKWAVARGAADPSRMQRLAEIFAADAVKSVAQFPDPFSMVQMLRYFQSSGSSLDEAKLRTLVSEKGMGTTIEFTKDNDESDGAFDSAYWARIYLIATFFPTAEVIAKVPVAQIPPAALTPIPDLGSPSEFSHNLGINWARAWAIKALARQVIKAKGADDPEAQKLTAAYLAHVQAGIERHALYKDNYLYAHWVPQFAVFALTD